MNYLNTLKAEWRRWDYEELKQNKGHLAYFEQLYLRYFNDEEVREDIAKIVSQLDRDIEELNAKLNREDSTPKQAIRWYVE